MKKDKGEDKRRQAIPNVKLLLYHVYILFQII